MTIVLAHDHRFYKIDSQYFSTGSISNEVTERYTNIFGEMEIIARIVDKSSNYNNLSLVNNPLVSIFGKSRLFDNDDILEKHIKNADYVIARLPSVIGNKAITYAKKYKKPYLVEVVACPWDALWNHSIKGKIIAPFMTYLTKRNVYTAKYVSYVTQNFLQSRYPSKGNTISVSDVALQYLDTDKLEKRINKISHMDNKIVIGTIAGLNVKFKGQQYVIKAMSKLKKEGYNFEYQLVGSGDNSYLKKNC